MTSADDWPGLVPELEKWATVEILEFGCFRLTVDDVTRELHLTPDEWDDIDAIVYGGSAVHAAEHVRQAWNRATDEHSYLVYDGQYDVQPSAMPRLRR